jgi:general secretion pathway protein G
MADAIQTTQRAEPTEVSDAPVAAAEPRPARISFMEVIVAFSVLALLAGVLTPMVGSAIEESRRTRATEDCRAIADALQSYRDDTGAFPPGMQGDGTYSYANEAYFGFGAEVLNRWLYEGPKKYLKSPIGADPWGRPYNYHVYTRSDPYMDVVVFSDGPNHVCESWDGNLWNRGKFAGDDLGVFIDHGH